MSPCRLKNDLMRSFCIWIAWQRWIQDSLAESEVRLVAGCHATTLSSSSFSRVTGRWGGRSLCVPRCHAATTSCCRFILWAVILIPSLFHPGPLFTRTWWITFLLRGRANKEVDQADDKQRSQNGPNFSYNFVQFKVLPLVKKHGKGSDLGNTGRTKPVSLWHLSDFGPQAVHVAATITAITQQQAIIIVSLPTNLAGLDKKWS